MYWNDEQLADVKNKLGLIETWDVLKWMRYRPIRAQSIGLIETWDVLKWQVHPKWSGQQAWLIETWDVLKW